jgi:hypothetical protein
VKSTMANDPANEYHEKAEECRRAATATTSAHDKAAWLKLAEQWQTLAEHATRS